MKVSSTNINGLLIIEPSVFSDTRGYFFEAFNAEVYSKQKLEIPFVQDNISLSKKNTLRGLHYQLAPYAQSKLVQVLKGCVLDVAVDLRKDSPTYGEYYAIELSDENHLQFYIPRGFAHGFSVLSEEAIFYYKCDNGYNKSLERGIKYDDDHLNINWQIEKGQALVSPKDEILPSFKDAEKNFSYIEY